jgi:hypothetical protein
MGGGGGFMFHGKWLLAIGGWLLALKDWTADF